jgi:autotransporter translocation and assembly factor TamB
MKKILKIFLAGVVSIVVLIIGLVLLAYMGLQTPHAKSRLASTISNLASNETQQIIISDIEGHLPWKFSIPSLTIADAQGQWLSIKQLRLDWKPLALLHNTLDVTELHADSIIINRAPVAASDAPAQDSAPFSISNLPNLELGTISSPNIALPAAWMGGKDTQWALQLAGQGRNHITGSLDTINAAHNTTLAFTAKYDEMITLDVALHDDEGGVINRIATYPSTPLDAHITASSNTNLEVTGNAKATLADTEILQADFSFKELISLQARGVIPEFARPPVAFDTHEWTLDSEIHQKGSAWIAENAQLTYGNATLNMTGGFDTETREFLATEIRASIADIAPWAKDVTGNTEARLSLNGTTEKATLTLNAHSENITSGDTIIASPTLNLDTTTSLDAWIQRGWASADMSMQATALFDAQPIQLDATGTVQDDKVIALNTLTLTSPLATLTGDASYGLASKHINAHLATEKLGLAALSSNALQGTLDATVDAEGSLDALPITITARANTLQGLPAAIHHLIKDTANFKATAILSPDTIAIDSAQLTSNKFAATLKGTVPLNNKHDATLLSLNLTHADYAPIALSTSITQFPERLQLDNISFDAKNTQLTGTVNVTHTTKMLDGTLSLNSSDIAPLVAWANAPKATGTAKADVTFTGKKTQALQATLHANNISLPAQQLSMSALNVTADTSNLAQIDRISLQAKLNHMRMNDLELKNMQLALAPEKNSSAYKLHAKGSQASAAFELNSHGTVAMQAAKTTAKIASLKGAYAALPFELAAPTTLTLAAPNITLDDTLLRIADGTLQMSATQDKHMINATATLSDLPLKPLLGNAAPPTKAHALVTIKGKSARPHIRADVTLLADMPNDTPDATIKLNTAWNNTNANAHIKNSLSVIMNKEIMSGNISIPASISLAPFALTLPQNKSISGTLNADMALATLNGWTKPLGHQLSGDLKADIMLKGTVNAPDASGNITLAHANYDHMQFGVCMRDLAMNATFNKSAITITDMSAIGHRKKGRLNGSGMIDMAAGTINTNLTMEKLAIFCQGMAEGEIAGNLAVTGTLNDMLAKGKVALGPLDIHIPTGGAETITVIEHAYKQDAAKDNKPSMIALDMDVSIPERVYVRGRGLDAELGGAIHIAGTASKPLVEGKFTTNRGTLEFLGSTLNIKDGYVRFINNNPTKPYVYLKSQAFADKVDIGFTINGPASDPALDFASTPALPKDEIFALLLFGSRLAEITPFQALQLANAVANLSGKGAGGSMIGGTRDSLGLDALSVGVDETGAASVGAGKYITDKVYLGVEQGSQPGSRRFTTEIEVTPNITAQTSTTQLGEPTVGVEWKYDY